MNERRGDKPVFFSDYESKALTNLTNKTGPCAKRTLIHNNTANLNQTAYPCIPINAEH